MFLEKVYVVHLRLQGTLCPDERSITPTLRSRLQGLWEHVRYSRAKFEEEPDTGDNFQTRIHFTFAVMFWQYLTGLGSYPPCTFRHGFVQIFKEGAGLVMLDWN